MRETKNFNARDVIAQQTQRKTIAGIINKFKLSEEGYKAEFAKLKDSDPGAKFNNYSTFINLMKEAGLEGEFKEERINANKGQSESAEITLSKDIFKELKKHAISNDNNIQRHI